MRIAMELLHCMTCFYSKCLECISCLNALALLSRFLWQRPHVKKSCSSQYAHSCTKFHLQYNGRLHNAQVWNAKTTPRQPHPIQNYICSFSRAQCLKFECWTNASVPGIDLTQNLNIKQIWPGVCGGVGNPGDMQYPALWSLHSCCATELTFGIM